MKKEREDWLRLYHKTLKGIEVMIDVQRIVKDIKKMAEETNTMIMEMNVKIIDDGLDFYFLLFILFYFVLFSFIFLFLEQLRLGFISHAVTSVTN